MRALLPILAAIVLGIGCSRAPEQAKKQASDTSVVTNALASLPDILATVDGTSLTRKTALEELNLRAKALSQRVPSSQIDAMKRDMLPRMVEGFVTRTLLEHEVERRNIQATDAQIKATFAQLEKRMGRDIEEFMAASPIGPERMRAEVIMGVRVESLLHNALSNATAVSEAEVDSFMKQNAEDLEEPEQIHARHILIKASSDDSVGEKQQKRQRAEALRQQLLAGADFATLARKNSDCPSRMRGGDLGTFKHGKMVPAFEKAAFAQKVGDIGPVVESPAGFHIIQVLKHTEGGPMARNKVMNILRKQKHDAALKAFIEKLRSKATIEIAPPFKATKNS